MNYIELDFMFSKITIESNNLKLLNNLSKMNKTNSLFQERREDLCSYRIKVILSDSYRKIPNIGHDPNDLYLEIYGKTSDFEKGNIIYYISEYVAECIQSNLSQSLLVHCAAVYSPKIDRSIVIFGEKGSGKTTAAFRLCHELGFKLIGNDLVRIGISNNKLVTYEGSKWFDLRVTAIISDSYLRKIINNNEPIKCISKGNWDTKIKVLPSHYGINTTESVKLVGKILFLKLDETQENLVEENWTCIQAYLFLHERIGRHISGQTMPLQNENNKYFGSLPIVNYPYSFKTRDNIVNKIISEDPIKITTSDSSELIDLIRKGF